MKLAEPKGLRRIWRKSEHYYEQNKEPIDKGSNRYLWPEKFKNRNEKFPEIARNRFEWTVQLANFNPSGVILSEKQKEKKT